MPEFIDPSTLTPWGVALAVILLLVGLLTWVVRRIVTGQLMSRSQHDELMRMSNARGDDWKDTAEAKQVLLDKLTDQYALLLESTKTTSAFFKTVGGEHVAQTQSEAG